MDFISFSMHPKKKKKGKPHEVVQTWKWIKDSIFLSIDKKSNWWTFVRVYRHVNGTLDFFSLYIHTKTNRQNVRRTIELGVGIIEFFFWLEGFDIMKFKKLDWSIIMASFKFYKTWAFMKLNKNSKLTIKT